MKRACRDCALATARRRACQGLDVLSMSPSHQLAVVMEVKRMSTRASYLARVVITVRVIPRPLLILSP